LARRPSVHRPKDETELRLTVSIGIASLYDAESLEQLVETADAALYRAKAGGRDRIEVAAEPVPAAAPSLPRKVEWRVAETAPVRS
jgi:PleD family two-component response regulator